MNFGLQLESGCPNFFMGEVVEGQSLAEAKDLVSNWVRGQGVRESSVTSIVNSLDRQCLLALPRRQDLVIGIVGGVSVLRSTPDISGIGTLHVNWGGRSVKNSLSGSGYC